MSNAGHMSDAEERDTLADRAFGFWLFLMSDAIVFALLFATYAVLSQGHGGAPGPAGLFDLTRSAVETGLLLLSSLGFGLGMLALDAGRRWPAILWLMVTALLGLAFLALEIGDFRDLIGRGLAPQASGYLSAVFVLIGTHGLHVAMGILWIAILSAQLMVQGDDPQTRSRLLRLGYYWHFLDIVWIGIYSIVILPGFIA
jgi:cytochrome o ubiquinol oxidase subunit III